MTPSQRLFIVAPSGAGKSTFAASAPHIYDADGARNERDEPQLRAFRRARDWQAHNAIWHELLRRWVVSLPPDAVVLTHSFADAQAMGASPATAFAVVPSNSVHTERLKRRGDDEDRVALALHNRQTVEKEVIEHSLAVEPDFPLVPRDARGFWAAIRAALASRALTMSGGAV